MKIPIITTKIVHIDLMLNDVQVELGIEMERKRKGREDRGVQEAGVDPRGEVKVVRREGGGQRYK